MTAAPDPISISGGSDFYVPHFEVAVGDRPLSRAVVWDVMQVTYKDSTTDIDSFELTVNNWDADERRFKYHDRSTFEPGRPVEVQMGYLGAAGGGLRAMIRGTVTDLRVAFPASGGSTLVVGGLNVLHALRKEQKSEQYRDKTVSEIAAAVCRRLDVGFIPAGPKAGVTETRHPSILQDGEYDVVFLMRLARRAGYELLATEKGGKTALLFGPAVPSDRPAYKLHYGRTLTEFSPKLSFAHQVSEVVVQGWNPDTGQAIEVSEKGGSLKGKLAPGAGNPAEGRKEVLTDRPVRDVAAARELARATLARIHDAAVTASGSVVGLPDLRAGAQLAVSGLGRRFNGRYFVTATTHTLGTGGYVTQFDCRLEELSNETDGESILD